MLLLFVSPVVAEAALSRKGVIDEDQVEIIPERVTASCLDQNVCLSSCKKVFYGRCMVGIRRSCSNYSKQCLLLLWKMHEANM